MTEKRRQFSPQFKAEAVHMVVGLGRSLAAVARGLEINPGTLGNWVKAWREENPDPATATNPVEAARVAEMESEIRRLRMENEFLKKGRGLLRQDTPVAERCALIEAEKANYSIG